jgi:hypothetical protein
LTIADIAGAPASCRHECGFSIDSLLMTVFTADFPRGNLSELIASSSAPKEASVAQLVEQLIRNQ